MGCFNNFELYLNSNDYSDDVLDQLVECCEFKRDDDGLLVDVDEFEISNKLDELYEIATRLFGNVSLEYIQSDSDSINDSYRGYEIKYNENGDLKKYIKECDYCYGEFKAGGINGWELLKQEIETKAKKKNIKINWQKGYCGIEPAGDYSDEFYDLCVEILDEHGGLEGLSTNIKSKKIKPIEMDAEQIQKIVNKAGELGYYDLIDRIKKEYNIMPIKTLSKEEFKQKQREMKQKRIEEENLEEKGKTSINLDEYEEKFCEWMRSGTPLSDIIEMCKFNGELIYLEKLMIQNNFILQAIYYSPFNLEYLNEEMKDNEEIVLKAVTNSGIVLQYASDRLKDDKEIVKIAIKKDCRAFKYASERLRGDKELALMAVQQNYYGDKNGGLLLKYVSDKLRNDKEVAVQALKNNPNAYKYVGNIIKKDKEICELKSNFSENDINVAIEELKCLKEEKNILNLWIPDDSKFIEMAECCKVGDEVKLDFDFDGSLFDFNLLDESTLVTCNNGSLGFISCSALRVLVTANKIKINSYIETIEPLFQKSKRYNKPVISIKIKYKFI